MAWQNGYYYRKKRIGKRIISEYQGTGYAGLLASLQDKEAREKREEEQALHKAQIEKESAIDREIDAIGAKVDTLVTALFLASGYRQHKRQWRQRRNGR